MADIKLLIVEDDDKIIESYTDAIEEHNAQSQNNIIFNIKKNANECIELLKSNDYDAAIVDLRLESDTSHETSGNRILREITGTHRFPILVVTGTPSRIDPDIKQSIFLKVFDKTVTNNELLGFIEQIFKTGITRILGTRGKLEDLIQKIFWNHISDGFNYWLGKDSEGALLRYSINHLTEYLDQPETGSLVEYYYEPEYYITPPIKEGIATGDIVERNGSRFVVMNPACDLAPRKVEGDNIIRNSREVTLVQLLDIDEIKLKAEGYIEENKSLNKDKIKSYVHNNNGQFAFLPDYNDIKRSIIDFRKINTIKISEYENYKRLATIAMPFLKDIQGRFSQYYGRQGQPDLDKDRVVEEIIQNN